MGNMQVGFGGCSCQCSICMDMGHCDHCEMGRFLKRFPEVCGYGLGIWVKDSNVKSGERRATKKELKKFEEWWYGDMSR